MTPYIVRRSTAVFCVLTALSLLTACQDKRVKELNVGITQDSMMSVIAQGTRTTDSLPSVYRHERYLVNGKNLEVFYFDPENRRQKIDSTVPLNKLTPLVVFDGKMIGKGWSVWDSAAAANKITLPKH